ncbi:MAG: hypothetical protein FD152_457 [Xanthobacteraceae bacterium]|nr:MAG: hypothetical protein FD152_457 [Xanthobacteraceae bacterium]
MVLQRGAGGGAAAGIDGVASPPGDVHPTGGELISRYLAPLATHPAIAPALRTGSQVIAVARAGTDKVRNEGRQERPFVVRLRSHTGEDEILASAVIDASGTWDTPNRSRSGALGAVGEATPAVARHISYAMPDVLGRERGRFAGRRIAVLGAGHSAIGTLVDLDRLAAEAPGTAVTWLMRSEQTGTSFEGGEKDQLAARGALTTEAAALAASGRVHVRTGIRIDRLREQAGALAIVTDRSETILVDELVVATGFRPDHALASELRLSLDPALECPSLLAPMIDPNLHSCGTVRPHGHAVLSHPDTGYFIAGMKSYGRAPTFLMATGYEQVRSIVAHLAGDAAAADDLRLVLPETGVCSTDRRMDEGRPVGAGCCGKAPAAVRVPEMQD